MKTVFLFACSCLALTVAPAGAQSLRDVPVPAEFPPASYSSAQYVDSAGCVFIRAGVGDGVTWVPRLNRNREQLCGFAPSLAAATPKAQPKKAPQTRAAASSTPRPRSAPSTPAPARSPAAAPPPALPAQPRMVARPAPKAAPAPQATPAPRVQSAAAQPAPSSRTRRILAAPDPSRTACAGLTGVSAAYTVQHNGSPVRCGPQTVPYATVVRRGAPAASGTVQGATIPSGTIVRTVTQRSRVPAPGTVVTPESVPPGTLVAPARVYASQRTSLAGISVPEGMKPVWDDDRLNPRRAHQTFEGKARMEMMWTNTVPRRLIDRRTGVDVIHNYPGLQPPFTSFEAQRAAGVQVTTRGVYVPDPVTVTARATTPRRAAPLATTAPPATLSTRSAPAIAPENARPIYAQAGLFADRAQGRAAATRIAASGMPARLGTLARDGRKLTLVMAGPFKTRAEAERGAARLRGMGFGDVRLR